MSLLQGRLFFPGRRRFNGSICLHCCGRPHSFLRLTRFVENCDRLTRFVENCEVSRCLTVGHTEWLRRTTRKFTTIPPIFLCCNSDGKRFFCARLYIFAKLYRCLCRFEAQGSCFAAPKGVVVTPPKFSGSNAAEPFRVAELLALSKNWPSLESCLNTFAQGGCANTLARKVVERPGRKNASRTLGNDLHELPEIIPLGLRISMQSRPSVRTFSGLVSALLYGKLTGCRSGKTLLLVLFDCLVCNGV